MHAWCPGSEVAASQAENCEIPIYCTLQSIYLVATLISGGVHFVVGLCPELRWSFVLAKVSLAKVL